MEKIFKKVNYSDYAGKFDESFMERMHTSHESIDVETMRANLYGFTFTEDYKVMKIPDEFSMDYWRDLEFKEFEEITANSDDVFDSNPIPFDVFEKGCEQYSPYNIESDDLYDEDCIEDLESIDCFDDSDCYCVSAQEQLLVDAINSTGDGKTPETALCVIDVFQEYEYIERMIRFMGKTVVKQSLFPGGIDCLELEDKDGNIEKIYFDVKRRFEVGYFRHRSSDPYIFIENDIPSDNK